MTRFTVYWSRLNSRIFLEVLVLNLHERIIVFPVSVRISRGLIYDCAPIVSCVLGCTLCFLYLTDCTPPDCTLVSCTWLYVTLLYASCFLYLNESSFLPYLTEKILCFLTKRSSRFSCLTVHCVFSIFLDSCCSLDAKPALYTRTSRRRMGVQFHPSGG